MKSSSSITIVKELNLGRHTSAGVRFPDGLSPLATGAGICHAQHGELFQGQVEDDHGHLRRCLVSLPCASLYSRARFEPDSSGVLDSVPSGKIKALRAVQLVLEYLGVTGVGGILEIESNVPDGKGYGSSTADCTAAAQAVARSVGVELLDDELARLVVKAEIASDNFMYGRAVLFAHREGVVLEDYFRPLPELEVLGIDTDSGAIVETLSFPPAEYTWSELESFRTVLAALRRAVRFGDIELLARVATASAVINQRYLCKPLFDEVKTLVRYAGALGVGVAHSGTVLSILLDPGDPRLEHKVDFLRTGLGELGTGNVLRFRAPQGRQRYESGHAQKTSFASA